MAHTLEPYRSHIFMVRWADVRTITPVVSHWSTQFSMFRVPCRTPDRNQTGKYTQGESQHVNRLAILQLLSSSPRCVFVPHALWLVLNLMLCLSANNISIWCDLVFSAKSVASKSVSVNLLFGLMLGTGSPRVSLVWQEVPLTVSNSMYLKSLSSLSCVPSMEYIGRWLSSLLMVMYSVFFALRNRPTLAAVLCIT